MSNCVKELREAGREIKLQLAIETLDLIEERIGDIKNMATPSGYEMMHSQAHSYLIRMRTKQQKLIEKLEQDTLGSKLS